MKSLSTKSTSLQPRISVTAAPENRIVQDDDKTRMIASASSLMSKSAHRFLFVNSNVDGALEELVAGDDDDDELDGCGADMRTNITLFGQKSDVIQPLLTTKQGAKYTRILNQFI